MSIGQMDNIEAMNLIFRLFNRANGKGVEGVLCGSGSVSWNGMGQSVKVSLNSIEEGEQCF